MRSNILLLVVMLNCVGAFVSTWLGVPKLLAADEVSGNIAALADRKPVTLEDAPQLDSLSERMYERLSKAQLLLAEEKFAESLDLLSKMEESTAGQPFAHAQVLQTKGFVYAQMSKYPEAIAALQASLKLNALPLRGTLSSMMTLGQLYMAKEDFAKAIPLIQDVIHNSESKQPQHYVALAQCFAALKLYKPAVEAIDTAIKLEPTPKESWLQLLVALNYSQQNYQGAIAGLNTLIGMAPENKKYWKQLGSIYLAAGRDREAVATMEVAYKNGFWTEEKELTYFLSLLYHNDIPWKAAQIMATEITSGRVSPTHKNYEMLANFWTRSHDVDNALAALDKAANLATDGQIFVQQGNLYLARENWQKASEALANGIAKGNIKRLGNAFLSLGIAQYKLNKASEARKSFESAKGFPQSKVQADQWLAHLESEVVTQ